MSRALFIWIICMFYTGMLQAQEGKPAADSLQIYYRQGYRYVEPEFRENRTVLIRFGAAIDSTLRNRSLERVVIRSYASPEGTGKANARLAELRADSLASYLLRHTNLPADRLESYSGGVAWDLLRNRVAASDMKYRDEVLRILDHTPIWVFDGRGKIVDGRKKQLMDLRGGEPYNYMYEHFFPDLRSSVSAVLYVYTPETIAAAEPAGCPEPEFPQPEIPPAGEVRSAAAEPEADDPASEEFRPWIAVKTNLLYWATIMPDFRSYTFVPNFEAEWFFCDRWSLSGAGNYAKWGYRGGEFLGISSWSLEPRWWFRGDGRYRWFYLGIYGQAGDYDVQNGRVANDGSTGKLWGTGLSIGAAIPFSNRFGLEVGIRGGYRRSGARIYSHEAPDYFLDYETNDNHWGVTGIKASLYFRFGKGSK